MKIAVCVSGQQRKTTIDRSILQWRMEDAFSSVNADFYYHTWIDSVLYDYPKMYKRIEPNLDYHPMFDVKHKCGVKLERKRKNNSRDSDLGRKFQHGSKQILAHAFLCDKLNCKYDMIVRARWDLYFSDKLDYKELLEKSYEQGVHGYGNPGGIIDYNLLDNPIEVLKSDNYYLDNEMLMDALIFHRPEWFDTSYVYELHKNKELLPSEWGFYETMSKPFNDHHTNFLGGVITARNGVFNREIEKNCNLV